MRPNKKAPWRRGLRLWYNRIMNVEEQHNARKDALAFLKRHTTAVLATASLDGQPHASMIFYTADDQFAIHFLTRVGTRKFEAIQKNPRVAITIATADVPQTLQIEGVARSIALDTHTPSMKPQLLEMLDLNHWFRAPITKQDSAMVHEVRIEPSWVRWADYAFEESGDEHVFKEIPIT